MHHNPDCGSVSASACAVAGVWQQKQHLLMLLHILLLAMRQGHGLWHRSTTTTGILLHMACSCVPFYAAVFLSATMCPTNDGQVSLLV